MTVSASGSRSIASPLLRMTPERNSLPGGDDLHRGDGQRERAWAGDDEHGDGDDDGVVQRGAGDQPADRVSAAVTCTTGA